MLKWFYGKYYVSEVWGRQYAHRSHVKNVGTLQLCRLKINPWGRSKKCYWSLSFVPSGRYSAYHSGFHYEMKDVITDEAKIRAEKLLKKYLDEQMASIPSDINNITQMGRRFAKISKSI